MNRDAWVQDDDKTAHARGGSAQIDYPDEQGLEFIYDDRYMRSEKRECQRLRMIDTLGKSCSWGEHCNNSATHVESDGDNGFDWWCDEHCIDNYSFI